MAYFRARKHISLAYSGAVLDVIAKAVKEVSANKES